MKKFLILLTAFASVCASASAQVEFRRGLEQNTFIPKGQWITGVSVSFSQSKEDNYQFLIVEDMTSNSYKVKVSPMLLYSFHDNMAAGGRFAYTRSRVKLDKARVVLASDTEYNIDNLYSISQNYSAMGVFRNYISLGRQRRFGLFNEVQLEVGGGESKLSKGLPDDFTGTFERTWNLNIGVAPGLVMFLNNYSAIEVNVGILGFNYTHTKSTTDQIYIADRNAKRANFKINLFSITFGVAFYL